MASTISTVAKWSESAGADKGKLGDVMRPRTRSEISLSIHARELVWLDQIRRGYSIKEIARREGRGCRRMQHGVSRARERAKKPRILEFRFRNVGGLQPVAIRNIAVTELATVVARMDRGLVPRLPAE